jgi:hypothetical protein
LLPIVKSELKIYIPVSLRAINTAACNIHTKRTSLLFSCSTIGISLELGSRLQNEGEGADEQLGGELYAEGKERGKNRAEVAGTW